MAGINNFYRGDTENIKIVVSRNGTPIDITGASIVFMMKKSITDLDPQAVITKSAELTNPNAGEAVIILSSTDTAIEAGRYYYDIQLTDIAENVSTLMCTTVEVKRDLNHG